MSIVPEDDQQTAEAQGSKRLSLQRLFRYPLHLLAAWREVRFARKSARLALLRYRQLRSAHPELAGKGLYEGFVSERNAVDVSAARAILQRAEASFATWPADHDLKFVNVVQYLIISEYLVAYPKRNGTTTNMARVIAQVIPREL
jgi:hypothetical protein